MGHQRLPTYISTDKSAAMVIIYYSEKKHSPEIDMHFYWLLDQLEQGHFQIFGGRVPKSLACCITKHYPEHYH